MSHLKIVDTMPFGTGFPKLPWTCPDCDEEVWSHSKLNFDIMSKIINEKKWLILRGKLK